MKSLIIATSAFALSSLAVPALAQTSSSTSYYINLGDTYLTPKGDGFNEVTGRLGARFGQNFGVEGEIGGGISNSHMTVSGGPAQVSEPIAGTGYAVGYLPIAPNFDLLARVGYGENSFHADTAGGTSSSHTYGSVNFGAGAQYMLTANDGIRGDYTRRDYQGSGSPASADTWALTWAHKF